MLGSTYREKLDNLGRYGYEGMELQGADLLDRLDEALAAFKGHSVRCSTICAGFRGALLAANPTDRQIAVSDIKALLEAAARLEAGGLIAVPIFGREPQVNDLSPWKSAIEVEWELLTVLWADLAEHARRLGTLLLIKPLMRYQTHLINRLEQGADLLRRVENPGTAMMADFFHMNGEEADICAALREHRFEPQAGGAGPRGLRRRFPGTERGGLLGLYGPGVRARPRRRGRRPGLVGPQGTGADLTLPGFAYFSPLHRNRFWKNTGEQPKNRGQAGRKGTFLTFFRPMSDLLAP
ncbi:MAG TPA: sugar phosphate isomerase/epimerase [Symbiobacteriaceae bacterium]|nr:sugar phosphate isomerase/epimerase [Symbiobacteriaceae bacterium]